jgi:hypothetical protein
MMFEANNRIIGIWAIDNYGINAEFLNGEMKFFDFKPHLESPVFKPLKDKELFNSVSLDRGVPVWCNGEIDIAPEVIYYEGILL